MMTSVTSFVQYTCEQFSTNWPGQFKIHLLRSPLAYASSASPATLWSVRRMTDSTSNSQRSTAPVAAGFMDSMNWIFSFSTEVIPLISPDRSKWSSLTASKHFFTNGWMRNGSFASERISSNSSFDKKKKRGNAIFLVSKKSFSPFSTISSSLLHCCRSSKRPGKSATSIIRGFACTFAMIRRQMESISLKAAPSLGICFMISSAPKMGSK
mmetsp:Transcript_6333/g.12262  ORF Transcript_6333/g.12262 Transcript_6333/m.12262 type:complete len:211 (-) Transcript_6333:3186-3818(-)